MKKQIYSKLLIAALTSAPIAIQAQVQLSASCQSEINNAELTLINSLNRDISMVMPLVNHLNALFSDFRHAKNIDIAKHPLWNKSESQIKQIAENKLAQLISEEERTDLLPGERLKIRADIYDLKQILGASRIDSNSALKFLNEVPRPSYYHLPEINGALAKKYGEHYYSFQWERGNEDYLEVTTKPYRLYSKYDSNFAFGRTSVSLKNTNHTTGSEYLLNNKLLAPYLGLEITTNLEVSPNGELLKGDSLKEATISSHASNISKLFKNGSIVSGVLGKTYQAVEVLETKFHFEHQSSNIAEYEFTVILTPFDQYERGFSYTTSNLDDLAVYFTSPKCQSEYSKIVGPIPTKE
jgi:hypothetical protein